ncbi:MAG: tyrosine-type recombinase/integrase [Peptococcaceae bacterium]|jgi:integrase/recombinase XerD|nr:tyrosine-type recombinase/integrase [Peptococcaceae bacterium]
MNDNNKKITISQIRAFETMLKQEERSSGTVEKYLRDVRAYALWLDENPVSKEQTMGWKGYLLSNGYATVTINSMLSSLNRFFRFCGWDDCGVAFLKVQRKMFREESKELTQAEYTRLIKAAHSLKQDRIELLMETICATGIRVSEVPYITVEAARSGRTEVHLKGKIRVILLPRKLCKKLLGYAKSRKISSGEIFLTKNGRSLSRRQIWSEMKYLCRYAKVDTSKVFPHNLRHLFAVTFYKVCQDIVKLADVLGHSSIETTRIYLLTNSAEHARQLDRLGLVL